METKILANLNHPSIPKFVESFETNGVHFLVQDYISGFPLSYYIGQGKQFPEAEVKQILRQLLQVLQYLHEPFTGSPPIVHRDLRLSNLFWQEKNLYLVDFGLAAFCVDASPTDSKSLGYTQPQLSKRPTALTYSKMRRDLSPRGDLFGAGVVALDLFCNWITEESLFQQPWQDILPASKEFVRYLEHLLIPEIQFHSAKEAELDLQALL